MSHSSRRAARPFTAVETLLIVVVIGLIGAIAWLALRRGGDDAGDQQAGPGQVASAGGDMTFRVYDGWSAHRSGGRTRVTHDAGDWPAFELQPMTLEQVQLVFNWTCLLLPDRAPLMAQSAADAVGVDATVTYTAVPCANQASAPAYVIAYLALNDASGQQVLFVLGPLDGQTWVLAHTDPFDSAPTQDLQNTLVDTVVSARRT